MNRPTKVRIDTDALRHNLNQVKRYAGGSGVIAMVKANAYGCGLPITVKALEHEVDAFGVACLEEALVIRSLGITRDCILIQGIFSQDELLPASEENLQCVLHQPHQLRWLMNNPLPKPLTVWVKVNTGMNRLGFLPEEVYDVLMTLSTCPWVDNKLGLLTHFANADTPSNIENNFQFNRFESLRLPSMPLMKSMSNSAAIISMPHTHADMVRPGIMLYGASPFVGHTGKEYGLKPVMHFTSGITAIRDYPRQTCIGYGATWKTARSSKIGIVPVGYGDGYPRHISSNTPVWVNGHFAPIVGRISMDMMTIDLTDCSSAALGDGVELWGEHVPVETIAQSAGTIAYELLCQYTPRIKV